MHSLLIMNIDVSLRIEFLFRSVVLKTLRILEFGPKSKNQQMSNLKRTLSNAVAGEAFKFVHSL